MLIPHSRMRSQPWIAAVALAHGGLGLVAMFVAIAADPGVIVDTLARTWYSLWITTDMRGGVTWL